MADDPPEILSCRRNMLERSIKPSPTVGLGKRSHGEILLELLHVSTRHVTRAV
jgi:hypothetical protein